MSSRYHQAVIKYHEHGGTAEDGRYHRYHRHSKRNSQRGVHRVDARRNNCIYSNNSYASALMPKARTNDITDSQIPKVIWCGRREGSENGDVENCPFNTFAKSDRIDDHHHHIPKFLISRGDDDLRDHHTELNVNRHPPIPRTDVWRDFSCCMGEEYILSNHHHNRRENVVLNPSSPPRLARHSSSSSSFFDHRPPRRPLSNTDAFYSHKPEKYIQRGEIWNSEERDCLGSSRLPLQTRLNKEQHLKQSLHHQTKLYSHRMVGDASLDIHRLRLPSHLCPLLEHIIDQCELYAKNQPHGWLTELYSLTRQDLALPDIPSAYGIAKPIISYIMRVVSIIYGIEVEVDYNQPHVLKYSVADNHKGVELHRDKSAVTVNLMMSKRHHYQGGGTYFPEAKENVRLDYGEFLLHRGDRIHGGSDISNGTRYLMVIFADRVTTVGNSKTFH